MLYGLLKTTHPEYAGLLYGALDDFYEGGERLFARAKKYLPPFPNEPVSRYQERVRNASYVNHMCEMVDFFVANLFTQGLAVTPPADADDASSVGGAPKEDQYYQAFANDCDRKGTDFSALVRKCAKTALLKGKCLVGIDLPAAPEQEPTTRADEDALGLADAYAFDVPVEALIDWKYAGNGRFAWAMLRRCIMERDNPRAGARTLLVEEFRLWWKDPETGRVSWELYRTEPRKPDKEVRDDEDIPLAASGVTSFDEIPLVELAFRDEMSGLWVGNKLLRLVLEHYRRRSMLTAAEDAALVEFPVLKLGPEITAPGDAMPAEVQQDPNRGGAAHVNPAELYRARGFIVIGKDDALEFCSPTGAASDTTSHRLGELVDAMHRITHQMAQSVANTDKALGRSGASKKADKGPTEVVLGVLGALFRDFGVQVYTAIAQARGDNVAWTPHGLDRFELSERTDLIDEATASAVIADSIPSPTFKKQYKTQLALALIGDAPVSVQDQIRKEIEQGVDEHEEHDDVLKEAMRAEAENVIDGEDEKKPTSKASGKD